MSFGKRFLKSTILGQRRMREKVNRACAASIKIQSHGFLSVSHSWGNANYLHSHPQPIVCLDSPELATSVQLESSRDETPRPRPAGNSACALQWGGKETGAVRFLVPRWRFQMFIMPAAPNGCQRLFTVDTCATMRLKFSCAIDVE